MGGKFCGVFRWWLRGRISRRKKQSYEYDYFCTYNDFSHHFYWHYLDTVDIQESLLFCIMCHKTCDHQIYSEGVPILIYWNHQNRLPFIFYDTTPNKYWHGGHHTCEHLLGYITVLHWKGKFSYTMLWFNVLVLKWIMDMLFSSQDYQHPSASL